MRPTMFNLLRVVLCTASLFLLCCAAIGRGDSSAKNIIPNGDFSKGNVGFDSDLPYIEPAYNCLWGGYYTVAATFDTPLLHRLIPAKPYSAPSKSNKGQKVLYANAGGTEPLVVWKSHVECRAHTKYLITFCCISFSGLKWEGDPPREVAQLDWVPDFQFFVNDDASAPIEAGCGEYSKGSMVWESGEVTSADVRIERSKFPHGGGVVGICDIKMVPVN